MAQNEAPLGIVYATDAAVENTVSVIGTFPAAATSRSPTRRASRQRAKAPVAEAFLNYLTSDTAQTVWQAFGFTVLD